MRADICIDGVKVGEINEGDRITRKKQLEYLRQTAEINKDKSYVKVYTKHLFELSRSLSGTENQFVNYLLGYIRYESGILAHENGKVLTRQTMTVETELSIKTIDRLLKSLIDKQVLGKHKTGHNICFTVNPYIFMRGSRVNTTLIKMFENSRWAK